MRLVYFLINSSLNGAKACYFYYFRPTNALVLVDDSGNGVSGSMTVGQNATLQNSQCSVTGSGSAVSISGNSLILTLPLHFLSPSFAGAKTVYMLAASNEGVTSGWKPKGSWSVP